MDTLFSMILLPVFRSLRNNILIASVFLPVVLVNMTFDPLVSFVVFFLGVSRPAAAVQSCVLRYVLRDVDLML